MLNEKIKNAMHLIDTARDDVLMLSKMNCHAIDVSSIVVASYGPKLTRMFLAGPSHALDRNGYPNTDFTVGIHDHRYSLTLCPVVGEVFNDRYEIRPFGLPVDKYEFTSGVATGKFELKKVGQAFISLASSRKLTENEFMFPDDLHTVAVYGPAAWMVYEGHAIKETTKLFTRAKPVQDPNLYQSFNSPAEVREHARKFFEQF